MGHDIDAKESNGETEVGLEIAASLNRTEDGQSVAAMLRHLKTLDKLSAAELSVGFDPINFEMFEDPDTREIFRVITEARLWEISNSRIRSGPNHRNSRSRELEAPADIPIVQR